MSTKKEDKIITEALEILSRRFAAWVTVSCPKDVRHFLKPGALEAAIAKARGRQL